MRNDLHYLTMLPWADVIPARGLLRPSRAWCPICYEEWYQSGQIIYDPLLWTLEVAVACPRHQRRLSLKCSNCGKSLPHLAPQARPGHCSHCYHWLGQDDIVEPLSEAELKWQEWVVEAVGEMIAAAPSLPEWPHREIVAEKISDWVERISGGNASEFASTLQEANIPISKWSIWDWQQGQQLPKLGMVLRMCYLFGTTPLRFFTQEVEQSISIQINLPELDPIKQEPDSNHEPFNAQKLLTELKAVLASDEYPPPSAAAVSQSLSSFHNQIVTFFGNAA